MNTSRLVANWRHVQQQVSDACLQAKDTTGKVSADNLSAQQVTLLAVSKTKPAEMVAALAVQGQREFG